MNSENTAKAPEETGELWASFIERNKEVEKYTFDIEAAALMLGIRTRSRRRDLVYKRLLFFYYAKKMNKKLTLKQIGNATGHDHATVFRGIKLVKDPFFYKEYLREYEEEVLEVIKKTDFRND